MAKKVPHSEISYLVEAHKQKIIELTKKLIRFKTENPAPANAQKIGGVLKEEIECLNFIKHTLKSSGFKIDQWKQETNFQNLVASFQGSGNGRSLLFNGHIDTVPMGEHEGWKFDPWRGHISEGRIHGLGSVDMKGGIAAFLSGIQTALQLNSNLNGNIIVEIVSDEEMAGKGTRECLKRGYSAEAAIFSEPTNLNIIICEPGLIHLRIEVYGRRAHSSTRYKSIQAGGQGYGINAIEKTVKIIQAIRELEKQWANMKTYPPLPLGLNYIHPGIIVGGPGGGKDGKLSTTPENPGTFPDYCSIEYELKFYPNENIEKIKKDFMRYLHSFCQLDPWLKTHPPKVTWRIRDIYFPPAHIRPTHPLVHTVSHIHQSFGREAKTSGFEAVSDMCWYSSQNIPSIVYGPGEIHLAHSNNESLSIDDLLYATKVYAGTILQWFN